MTDLPELHLSDCEMEEHAVPGLDLVWGLKSYRAMPGGLPHFIWEIRYRLPGDPRVVYVREKVMGDPLMATSPQDMIVVPTLVARLTRFLTDEAYRRECHALYVANIGTEWEGFIGRPESAQ